jgi:hypothetical protein
MNIRFRSEINPEHVGDTKLGRTAGFGLFYIRSVLDAFANLRKANISLIISVRPSVRQSAWNNSSPTGRIFIKLGI